MRVQTKRKKCYWEAWKENSTIRTILKGRNNQPVPQIKKEETLQINLNNMFDINNAGAVVLRSHTHREFPNIQCEPGRCVSLSMSAKDYQRKQDIPSSLQTVT